MPTRDTNHILIDGYNVIYSLPFLKKQFSFGNSAACNALLNYVRILHDFGHFRLTLVFDAQEKQIQIDRPGKGLNLSIIFTTRDCSADAMIEQLVQTSRHPDRILVVSRDLAINNAVIASGASILFPEDLQRWVEKLQAQQQLYCQQLNQKNLLRSPLEEQK